MTGIDAPIDKLVKAGWLAVGLSQTDLAEILGAAFAKTLDDNGSDGIGSRRLMQIAEALDIPVDLFCRDAVRTGQQEPEVSPEQSISRLQSLLELRLLRAFHDLRDHRTKRMLVDLIEQIVKRQANRGDAG